MCTHMPSQNDVSVCLCAALIMCLTFIGVAKQGKAQQTELQTKTFTHNIQPERNEAKRVREEERSF